MQGEDRLPDVVAAGDLVYVKWPEIHRAGWVIVTAVADGPPRRFAVLTPDGPAEAAESEVHGWRPG